MHLRAHPVIKIISHSLHSVFSHTGLFDSHTKKCGLISTFVSKVDSRFDDKVAGYEVPTIAELATRVNITMHDCPDFSLVTTALVLVFFVLLVSGLSLPPATSPPTLLALSTLVLLSLTSTAFYVS
jgi:hypothetical protein